MHSWDKAVGWLRLQRQRKQGGPAVAEADSSILSAASGPAKDVAQRTNITPLDGNRGGDAAARPMIRGFSHAARTAVSSNKLAKLFSSNRLSALGRTKQHCCASPASHTSATAVAAAARNDSAFCDYESAGVYDPNSGQFQPAGHSKKPAVQEYKLSPAVLAQHDQGPSVAGSPTLRRGGGAIARKHSTDSGCSSSSNSSWRAAAAAAAAGSGHQVLPGSQTAPGSQVAAMIEKSKVARGTQPDPRSSSSCKSKVVRDLPYRANTTDAPSSRGSSGPAAQHVSVVSRSATVGGHSRSSITTTAAAVGRGRSAAGNSGFSPTAGGNGRTVMSRSCTVDGGKASGSSDVKLGRSVTAGAGAGSKCGRKCVGTRHHLTSIDSASEEVGIPQ